MGINGVGTATDMVVQQLISMRAQLADLQQQVGTGKKADNYAGMGLDRGFAVGLRAKASTIEAYGNTIDDVGARIDLATTVLAGIYDAGQTVKSGTRTAGFVIDSSGQTTDQKIAGFSLEDTLGLLNTQFGDRYLFSGRATDRPAVESRAHIMNGDGARAGFNQIVSERRQADLGADGLGRLAIPPAVGSVVSISEDVAGSPFGFKLSTVTSALTGTTVTGPTGSPPNVDVDLGAVNPNAGETITFAFTLPDGSSASVTLKATTSTTPGANEFTIGATTAATAANLQTALTTAVGKLADTSLTAASAMAVADDFFNIDAANPPRRVAGPPFDTATALTAGTAADTVSWYIGEADSDPARSTALVRPDDSITVQYGLRANEEAIRRTIQNVAVFSVMTFSSSDPNASERYAALTQRVSAALETQTGVQKIADITAELAGSKSSLQQAKERHVQTSATIEDMLQSIEGVPIEEVATKILALDTRLQASLQTTTILYQTSLVNYM
jgi:flagellin-like hook-associated protein FlgL